MIISETIQGSPEWLAERAGNISASNFGKLITPGGKETTGETRKKYLYQLAAERITGEPEESFKNGWMERGNELEGDARLSFEERKGLFVAQIGMVYLDDRRTISCSPDGLIGDDSGLEIKCPKPSTHIAYLEAGKVPNIYVPQVQGCMWITGRSSWWFVSYCPGIRPLEVLVERDDGYIKVMETAIVKADGEVANMVKRHMETA